MRVPRLAGSGRFFRPFIPYILCILPLSVCSPVKRINLTPDVIRGYGLDQITLPRVQLYYRAITIRTDSSVSNDEPTVFRRIDTHAMTVTESRSPAAASRLDKDDIIILKDGTPCRIAHVLDSGRILQADFGDLKLDFGLSYRSGYSFELISDTIGYQGKTYVRSVIPLIQSVGVLSVDRKKLEQMSDTEIRIKGKRVEEENLP